jgi:hypothetical protein
MDDADNWVFGFLTGGLVVVMVMGVACTPPHDLIKAHTTRAMGCTVISPAEAAPSLEGLPSNAVYWRCKDGKVYVR